MSLSSFSSIFEVLAGLLIVFTGLEVATLTLSKNLNVILDRVDKIITDLIAKTALVNKSKSSYRIKGYDTLEKSLKSLLDYYIKLASINRKQDKTLTGKATVAELVLKKKFIPVFLYATFFTFYTLLLCGLSNTDDVLIGEYITVKAEEVCLNTLLIFDIFSGVLIIVITTRRYRIPFKKSRIAVKRINWKKVQPVTVSEKPYLISNPLRRFMQWPTAIKIFVVCTASFSIALLLNLKPWFSLNGYGQVGVIMVAILVAVFPFMALFVWLKIGFSLKDIYIVKWANCLLACYVDEYDKGEVDLKLRNKLNKFNRNKSFIGLANIFVGRYRWSLVLGIASMAIFVFSILNFLVPKDKQGIDLLIVGETDAEFRSYSRLPEIDTLWFDRYFTATGKGRKKIRTALMDHREKGQTISHIDNPSTHNMDKEQIKIIGWNSGRLKVQTAEYWYLRWFDKSSQKPSGGYVSPSFYPQFFYLKKDKAGKWKIDDIEYFGIEIK